MFSNSVPKNVSVAVIIFLSFVGMAQASECIPYNLNVSSDADIKFEFVFHQDFATDMEINTGAKSDPVVGSYRVSGGNKTKTVSQVVALGEGFDLRGSDREVMDSLKFVVDMRGGSDVRDHQPVVTSVDRGARTATISVVLENESLRKKTISWTAQLAQDNFVVRDVDAYPVESTMEPVVRMFDSKSGSLNDEAISYNSANAANYLSVVHADSQCVLNVYELNSSNSTYALVRSNQFADRVVSIQTANGLVGVTVELNAAVELDKALQKSLRPELIVLD